ERSVRGAALLGLDQFGRAVRPGRKGSGRGLGLRLSRGGNRGSFGRRLFNGGRLGQYLRVHLLGQPGRVVAGHLGRPLGGGQDAAVGAVLRGRGVPRQPAGGGG